MKSQKEGKSQRSFRDKANPSKGSSSDQSKRHNDTSRYGRGKRATATAERETKSATKAKCERRSNVKSEFCTPNGSHNSSSKQSFCTPKNQRRCASSTKADASQSNNRSPTKVILSPAKKLVEAATNLARVMSSKPAMKDASTQTEPEKHVVFTLRLNRSVLRSLQNRAEGNQNRAIVGTGQLKVLKCIHEHRTLYICQLIGDDGALKFQADIPNSLEAIGSMYRNVGVQNSFVWHAYDSSGDYVMLRSFYFFFDDGPDMFSTLLHFFGGNDINIVREFLAGGRFQPDKELLPPHSIVKNEDDMDIESDDEEHAAPPLSKEQEASKYGKVVEMSVIW